MRRSALLALILLPALCALAAGGETANPNPAEPLGEAIVLSWNDLGMHCMNRDHDQISILPPYNNLLAQVILRGDENSWPQVLTEGVTLEYSIPGNTYSVGKTNFWDYAYDLFGVHLPPNIGLTGLGLTGEFTSHPDYWAAEGIPVTPFTDAEPLMEDPYQQALVILRDEFGTELHRSEPVIPVSTEVNCVSSGCHSSVDNILNMHSDDGGFDPSNTPILCAWCHGSPPLTGPDPGPHGYFSKVIHEKHSFIDNQIPGIAGCEKCHPGPNTACLRGTMATDYGMICQDCHGDMDQMKNSIENGRIPWLNEPACRDCHTAQYGEPVGQLYRLSTGHGGVMCAGCHNSPHAIWPSRESRDNENAVALQGHSGILRECNVCHGYTPSSPGPHGFVTTDVVESELMGTGARLTVYPSPLRVGETTHIMASGRRTAGGRLLVFDARGRTVRMLDTRDAAAGELRAVWDGKDKGGQIVPAGVYFVQWRDAIGTASGKLVLLD